MTLCKIVTQLGGGTMKKCFHMTRLLCVLKVIEPFGETCPLCLTLTNYQAADDIHELLQGMFIFFYLQI